MLRELELAKTISPSFPMNAALELRAAHNTLAAFAIMALKRQDVGQLDLREIA